MLAISIIVHIWYGIMHNNCAAMMGNKEVLTTYLFSIHYSTLDKVDFKR